MGISSFKELDVWKMGIDIADSVYDITANFPKNEIVLDSYDSK